MIAESLKALAPILPTKGRGQVASLLSQAVDALRTPIAAAETKDLVDAAVGIGRTLYSCGRSREALALAQAVLAQCTLLDDRIQTRRAAMLCGLLLGDSADLVGAIEYHAQALRLSAQSGARFEMSQDWGNIGVGITAAGNYALAAKCYQRSLELVDSNPGPVYPRYTACLNLADCLFHLGDVERGLRYAERALREMTPEFQKSDPYTAILLRRNLVRLLIAAERLEAADVHSLKAMEEAREHPSPRSTIAADTTRASVELATGRVDVALTRLERALDASRKVPAALHDTLACMIRADEASGNVSRALMRLDELSEHVYRSGVQRIRDHLALYGIDSTSGADTVRSELARARLADRLAPPGAPENLATLQRLAVGAALRMDASGWHGVRVGALAKGFALALGQGPLEALEVGVACELHDIGMVAVPAAILAKKGTLNPAETEIVRRHVTAGVEMLRGDNHRQLLLASDVARFHHAWWDGSGYPERVSGRSIPLAARICAIADSYDAMVSGIGGRAPMTMGEALAELERGSETQFDPELVPEFDTFVRRELEVQGIDPSSSSGMEDFRSLVVSLMEDRGLV
ncbi:HD domain-containing phosphohydrolase [Usitatibacter palustris]|uniref:HD-GYP domain-containing protein n=1 Tax=Usitatibacter palustris TaxID=2732487 RepID=A0A6M4H909_9PROT|nr:HD domain-containing phosphohydrolase [Usitatibacter palustris]QJR14507.1 hypothetical protein DSM104440_01308 [Usitatibacter palustris]